MSVVEWLERVRKMDYAVDNLLQQKAELRALAERVTPGRADGMPRSRGAGDRVGSAVQKLVDLEQEINKSIDKFVDFKMQVCQTLLELPATQYQALYLHYIRYFPWSKVAEEMNYSPTQVERFRIAGLKNLERMVGNGIE